METLDETDSDLMLVDQSELVWMAILLFNRKAIWTANKSNDMDVVMELSERLASQLLFVYRDLNFIGEVLISSMIRPDTGYVSYFAKEFGMDDASRRKGVMALFDVSRVAEAEVRCGEWLSGELRASEHPWASAVMHNVNNTNVYWSSDIRGMVAKDGGMNKYFERIPKDASENNIIPYMYFAFGHTEEQRSMMPIILQNVIHLRHYAASDRLDKYTSRLPKSHYESVVEEARSGTTDQIRDLIPLFLTGHNSQHTELGKIQITDRTNAEITQKSKTGQ